VTPSRTSEESTRTMIWGDLSRSLALGVLGAVALGCASANEAGTVHTPDGPVHVVWAADEVAQERSVRPVAKSDTASYAFVRLGRREALHRHDRSDATIVVLSGKARVRVGNRDMEVSAGDVVFIPRGTPHSVENLTPEPLEAFAVFSPQADPKDRIYIETQTTE